MYISKAKIVNFKSIRELELNLKPGKNVLVGPNNSGKSNIIEAINIVMGENYPSKKYEEKYFFKDTDTFSIIVELSNCKDFDETIISAYDKKTKYYIVTDDDNDILASSNEIEQLGSQSGWIEKGEHTNIIKNAEKIAIALEVNKTNDIKYSVNIYVNENDVWKMSYFPQDWISSFITSAVVNSDRNIQKELLINNYSWYGKMIKEIFQNAPDEIYSDIKEHNKLILEDTNKMYKPLQDELNKRCKYVFEYDNLEFNLMQNTKDDLYKGMKILIDDGFYSLLEDKGSGIKSMMIIELFEEYCNRHHKGQSCLLIEEPELYLHPHARRILAKQLDDIVQGGNQVILTTHSQDIVNDCEIANISFVSKRNGETVAKQFDGSKYSGNDIEKINILLKTENSEIIFADKVILVEGGEKHLYKKIIEINHGRNFLDYNNVSIIGVGGKDRFEIYKKILDSLEKEMFIIADLDIIREGIGKIIDRKQLEKINTIKSKCSLSTKEELKRQNEMFFEFIDEIKSNNIYILKHGELEDYYNEEKANEIFNIHSIKSKEAKPSFLSYYINQKNISQYIHLNYDLIEVLNHICSKIKENVNDENLT